MVTASTIRGRIALMVAHCAGMLDLVALPLWIGVLIEHNKLDPQQAVGMVSLFLFGVVISSIFITRHFHQVNRRWVSGVGFFLSGLCFAVVSQNDNSTLMLVLHFCGGLAAGSALSVTHGTIAQTHNPHRQFAIVGTALGVFSVVFLGATPVAIEAKGGPILFVIFSCVMLVASAICTIFFPVTANQAENPESHSAHHTRSKIPPVVWFGIIGLVGMSLVQAMTFSFLERVGADRGFGIAAITGVLITLGIVNLFPAPLAAVLENRISTRWVLLLGAPIQAVLSFLIVSSSSFALYAFGASLFAGVLIFTHTFAFGALAHLDTSNRAMAATPALVMTGGGIGPVLGGTLVKSFGYEAIGVAAFIIAIAVVFCFSRIFSVYGTQSTQENVA